MLFEISQKGDETDSKDILVPNKEKTSWHFAFSEFIPSLVKL